MIGFNLRAQLKTINFSIEKIRNKKEIKRTVTQIKQQKT